MWSFLRFFPTVEGRLTSGVALIIAITAGLWPDQARAIDPVKAGAVVVAALAWLFAELGALKPPSPHDLKLFDEIAEHLPEGVLGFLREQDYGVRSFHDPGLKTLHEMAGWKGSRFNFVDGALQKRWSKLHEKMRQFSSFHARNTWPVENAMGVMSWLTVHPTVGDPEDPEDFVQERIDKLNETATELVGDIDKFEDFTRKRLNL